VVFLVGVAGVLDDVEELLSVSVLGDTLTGSGLLNALTNLSPNVPRS